MRPALPAKFLLLGVLSVLAVAIFVTARGAVQAESAGGTYGLPLDTPSDSNAARAAADPALTAEDRKLLRTIARQPSAVWLAQPERLVAAAVGKAVAGADERGAISVLVAYNIPGRDCGGHSASLDRVDAARYRAWVRQFIVGLGDHRAIVVLEPDALAQLDCLSGSERELRRQLLRFAITRLSEQGSWVYVDIGHSDWLTPDAAAERLAQVGVERAAGFALNVSNFNATEDELAYGREISRRLGGETRFVIDTGRNGRAVESGEWCNPREAGLGRPPSSETNAALVDAFLWIKPPGNSDGPCNGGPRAGQWWQKGALELARNAVTDD